MKWQYKVRSKPNKRWPAIADRAVRKKVTKWQAGIRRNSAVEKEWKIVGGNQQEILSIDKFAGYKAEVKERIEIRERLALRNKVKEEQHIEMYGGLREEIAMKPYVHDREYAETAVSWRGPGPARKKE